ncbi:MAG: tetratricopeptide repeat protein, partial [Acidobacteria bacterium]|nr:tetratricopeptide repeat protein [Acidobacteriota bacterium]
DGMLAGIWHVTHDSAMWYQALGDLPRAIRYYERALEIADRVAPRDMRAITLRHLAGAEGEAGRFDLAAAHFEEALELFERHQIREGIPETLVGLARLLIEAGDRDRARELVGLALEEAARQNDAAMIVSARLVRGRILIEDGELERAREDYEEAIRIAVANGLRPLVPAGIEGLARIDAARGELESALDRYEESAKLIESMRQAIPSHEQRVAFASATSDTFRGLVGVLLALHERGEERRGEEALLATERGRTQNLRATFGRPEPRAVAVRAAQQSRLATLQGRLATAAIPAERIALDRELDDVERELHTTRVESSIGEPPASIAALRKTLSSDEA